MLPGSSVGVLRLLNVTFAVVVASVSAGQTVPTKVDQVAGRWELRGRWSSEAISQITELNGRGWYRQTLITTVRLHYEYNGADLVLTALNNKGEPDPSTTVVLSVRFDGDTLTETSTRDTLMMVRSAGGEFAGDIKGRWLMLRSPTGHSVTHEFLPDGYLLVMNALSGEVGQYRLLGGKQIEWRPMLPVGEWRRTNFKIENEKLVLSDGKLRDELIRLR